ncbi:unnamed protein product, partial [Hapterophycus canaliculatus]
MDHERRLKVGTRVDCLFEGDYFRGTVDEINSGERPTFRIIFDDGDVREDVPPEDLELPLEPRCPVECLFESDDAYFDGVIAKDNGDATYQVDFDDGDVLSAAPRSDIRFVSSPDGDTTPGVEESVEDQRRNIDDAMQISDAGGQTLNSEGAQRIQHGSGDDGATGDELAAGDHSPGRQGNPSSPNGLRHSADYREDGDDRDDRDDNHDENIQRYTTDSALSNSDAGQNDSQRNRDPEPEREQANTPAERSRMQKPTPGSISGTTFTPTVSNALHTHLDALAVAVPRLLVDAPPDYRLWAACHRMAALEEQLRQQEARGEAWNLPVFSEIPARHAGYSYQSGNTDHSRSPDLERVSTGAKTSQRASNVGARAGEPYFPAHAELRKVVEDLSALRMRQVALVRLCYGDASLEMVQAITDLADGYAKEGLWPQVSNHMARAANILAIDQDQRFRRNDEFAVGVAHAWRSTRTVSPGPISRFLGDPGVRENGSIGRPWEDRSACGLTFSTEDRYSNPALWCSLHPARCARLLLELFKGLRAVIGDGDNTTGQVVREDLEAFFRTNQDKTIRSATPGLVKGAQMPRSCAWGVAVDCLRQNSSSFADLNLKVMEGVQPKQAAKIRLAFQAADPANTGCAHAQVLALTVAVSETKQTVDGRTQETAQERRRSLLSVRVKLLTGRYQTHTNSLPAACRNLAEALTEVERLGLGEASGCVPVLNALTDALALTHRLHTEKSASKAKKLAQTWIQGTEGQELWKQECKRLLLECRRRLEVVPRAEIETRTRQALVAYRSKIVARELLGQGKELNTAESHLVRAWEILESRHGRMNPDVGAACISLGNLAVIRRRRDEAVDWFRRALGTFEVLHEATGLMEKAANFYSGRVEKALARRERAALL